MKTYLLDPQKLEKTKRNVALLYGVTALVMLVIIMWLSWENLMAMDWFSIMVIPFMLALFIFSGIRAVKQRKDFWAKYKLTISEDTLTQSQPRFPDLNIHKSEVVALKEEKYGLLISTEKYQNLLAITRNLQDIEYEEVKTTLYGWLAQNETVAE